MRSQQYKFPDDISEERVAHSSCCYKGDSLFFYFRMFDKPNKVYEFDSSCNSWKMFEFSNKSFTGKHGPPVGVIELDPDTD